MQTVFTNVPHLAEIMNKEKSHQVRIMTLSLHTYYTLTPPTHNYDPPLLTPIPTLTIYRS